MKFIIIATLFTYGGSYEERPYPDTSYPTKEVCEHERMITMEVGRQFWLGMNFGKGTVIDYGVRCEEE